MCVPSSEAARSAYSDRLFVSTAALIHKSPSPPLHHHTHTLRLPLIGTLLSIAILFFLHSVFAVLWGLRRHDRVYFDLAHLGLVSSITSIISQVVAVSLLGLLSYSVQKIMADKYIRRGQSFSSRPPRARTDFKLYIQEQSVQGEAPDARDTSVTCSSCYCRSARLARCIGRPWSRLPCTLEGMARIQSLSSSCGPAVSVLDCSSDAPHHYACDNHCRHCQCHVPRRG